MHLHTNPPLHHAPPPGLGAPRGATFVAAMMWVTLVLAALAVWLCWGLAGRHAPDTSLGVALVLAAGVLPGLGVWTVRRAERDQRQ